MEATKIKRKWENLKQKYKVRMSWKCLLLFPQNYIVMIIVISLLACFCCFVGVESTQDRGEH
jgi:hypothetical protein